MLSGGCKVAFGPMQPDIGPDFTDADASENGADASAPASPAAVCRAGRERLPASRATAGKKVCMRVRM